MKRFRIQIFKSHTSTDSPAGTSTSTRARSCFCRLSLTGSVRFMRKWPKNAITHPSLERLLPISVSSSTASRIETQPSRAGLLGGKLFAIRLPGRASQTSGITRRAVLSAQVRDPGNRQFNGSFESSSTVNGRQIDLRRSPKARHVLAVRG